MGTNAGRFFHTSAVFSNWGGLLTWEKLGYVERFRAFPRFAQPIPDLCPVETICRETRQGVRHATATRHAVSRLVDKLSRTAYRIGKTAGDVNRMGDRVSQTALTIGKPAHAVSRSADWMHQSAYSLNRSA